MSLLDRQSTSASAGSFNIIEELGSGAHSIVYRAELNGAEYAVKVQREENAGEAGARAFRREAAILACIHHPGLARIEEVGETGGRSYLVMELLHGATLRDTLRADEPLSETQAVATAIDVAGALAAAHRAGLVHRDVKPENLFVTSTGTTKVIDFGLATQAGANQPIDTAAGTALYSPPEQTGMLKRPVDGRSDLYSLGVVLFECVAGRIPFEGDDIGELVRRHAVEAPPDLRRLRPDLSPAFVAVVERLLAKDPDDRYQTGEGLLVDLERLAQATGTEPADFPVGLSDDPAAVMYDVPLVGRKRELHQLLGSWESVCGGRGAVVLVEGPPGGGKSRLVREVLRRVQAQGGLVLAGKANFGNPVPLLPLREAIEDHLRNVDRLPEPGRSAARETVIRAAGGSAELLATFSPALAAVLGSPVDSGIGTMTAPADRREQFVAAVGSLFADLASAHGGAVLAIDDLQWLDDSSRRALATLSGTLGDAPLLVLGTARDDAASAAGVEQVVSELGGAVKLRVALDPLDRTAVKELALELLGGSLADDRFVLRLHQWGNGNPLATVEYLRAVLDAGLLRPSWGSCVVDTEALDQLSLPEDVIELVLRRADGLGADTRSALEVGAAIGTRFRPDLLEMVLQIDQRHLAATLADALRARLIERCEDDEYAFVHDRIREALLEPLEPAERRGLHQRIAEAIEAARRPGPDRTFALARHYALGDTDATPGKVCTWNTAAGRAAMANYASAEAVQFFTVAEDAAIRAGDEPDAELHETLGVVLLRVGEAEQARRRLRQALDRTEDGLARGRIYEHLSRAANADWRMDESWESAIAGLDAIGHPLPTNPLRFWLGTFWHGLVGMLVMLRGRGYGAATADERAGMRTRLALLDAGGVASFGLLRPLRAVALALRALPLVHRLGDSRELVGTYTGLGMVAATAGLERTYARLDRRANAATVRMGDPAALVRLELHRCLVTDAAGRNIESGDMGRRLMRDQARWLDTEDLTAAAIGVPLNFDLRGYYRESHEMWLSVHSRLFPSQAAAAANPYLCEGFASHAALGHRAEAARLALRVEEAMADSGANRFVTACYVQNRLRFMIDQDELQDYDRLMAQLDALRLNPVVAPLWLKTGWLAAATAALELARREADGPTGESTRLAEARKRVKALGKVAKEPVVQAHHRACRAALAVLEGDPGRAAKLCLEAELLATEADAPIVHLEVARVRARLAGAAAQEWECRRQVDTAVRLAAQHGWVNVTTALRSEFGFARVGSTSSRQSSHLSMSTPSPSASRTYNGSLQNRRSLDALLALGMAAAAVHDPDELAVVALDQLVALLAAERAFLFLQQEDGTLTVAAARDAAGSDLVGVSDFASTIVDEVSEHHRALVVTGTAEGAALGSESAVLHDLRSILAAPLTLEGRFLGVVYLDSRLAKGIFTADDVEILSAMSTHIAVSLMTARATKLEVTVAAEREQRHVAETLRDFMTEVSSSVEPDEVLARALITARQLVNYDRAAILSRRGRDWVVQTSVGELDLSSADKLGSHSFLIDMEPTTAPLLVVDASGPGAPPPPPLFAGSGSWIALPSVIGGRLAGVVLYGTDRAGGLGPAQLEFAATFAAQAVSAFVNAEQYQQIQRLATTDELTAVNNRRNFFQLGAQAFSQARRYQRPLAAVMIDIDHFKRVNDTHGHTVGDEVIETVARRLRAVIREVDVIGRYGGEEFALVLPETSGAAANLVAERLRHALQDQPVDTAKGPLTVTVSLGVAVMDPLDADLPAALKRADEALYEAKRQGRNSVVMAPPPGPPDQPAADRDGA